MYTVKHDLTHYEWSTNSKDDLLFELDILQKKHSERGSSESLSIRYMDDTKQIVDERTLTLPLTESIDDYLSDFGVADTAVPEKKKRFSMFGSLFSRRKNSSIESEETLEHKEVSSESVNESYTAPEISIDTESVLSDELLETLESKQEETEIMVDSENIDDEENITPLESTKIDSESDHFTDSEEAIEIQSIVETEYDSEVFHSEALVDEVETSEEEIDEEVVESVSSDKNHQYPLQRSSQTTMSSVSYRDIDSLSTYDLQNELEDRILFENQKIEAYIQKLQKRKRKNELLLQTLKNVDLLED